jgi:hypothetical protein
MRLWSLHPQYLDGRGLVALWREALLAQQVLLGRTRGYRHHPQLDRFWPLANPAGAIAAYLLALEHEATMRGYSFDAGRIVSRPSPGRVTVTCGQLDYELVHLRRKLWKRDRRAHARLCTVRAPLAHPLFDIVPGPVEPWEVVR